MIDVICLESSLGSQDPAPDTAEAQGLHRAYLDSLVAPMDGMWLSFAQDGRRRLLQLDGETAGFFVLGDDGALLQLYVTPTFELRADELFAAVIERHEVTGAMVSTADPVFLSLALEHQASIDVHTLLYEDRGAVEPPELAGAELVPVEPEELEAMAVAQEEALEQDLGDWLRGYLGHLIRRRELFALRRGEELLGTGETRVADLQPPYVDLGVITMKAFRRQGVASHILSRLKPLCYARDLQPICSTTMGNLGARKAITRAGFTARHRLLKITFDAPA